MSVQWESHFDLQFRYNDPTFCHSCGGDVHPIKQTHRGQICSDCRRSCAQCDDWLMGHAVTVDGKTMHPECSEAYMETKLATTPVDNACPVCGWDGCTDCLNGIAIGGAMGGLEVAL